MQVDSRVSVHGPRVCKQCGGDIPSDSRRNAYCSMDCYLRWRDLHVRPLLGGGRPRGSLRKPDMTAPTAEPSLAAEPTPPIEPLALPTAQDDADDTAWAARGAYWEDRVAKADKLRPGRVLILSGHGVALRLERGGLVVRSGFTYYPQRSVVERIFPTDRRKPSRIVILDSDGSLSFDVLQWCERQGISVVWLNWQGEVSVLTAGRAADAALIRAQVMMPPDEKRAIAADLIVQKVLACAATLAVLPRTVGTIEAERTQAATVAAIEGGRPESVEALMLMEARAAKAYFAAWRAVPLRWTGTNRRPIPEGWWRLDGRVSSLSGTNRHATHPVNALLNYAYGVLEGHVRIAIAARGLDSTLGIFHANHPGRIALVYDLMEPLRPAVDRAVLGLLMNETLHPTDFPMQADGVVRVHPELARRVAALAQVDPVLQIEQLVEALRLVPTPASH